MLSGKMTYLTLLPLMVRWSMEIGGLPFTVNLIFFMCTFIDMSTPVMVPETTVLFLSSTTTLSLLSFIKNLTSLMLPKRTGESDSQPSSALRGLAEDSGQATCTF